MRGSVVIVPDERRILADSFSEDIPYALDHAIAYQDFSDKYHLGLSFSDDSSQAVSLHVAQLGHFSYKTEENSNVIIFYLPEVITERQMRYFDEHFIDFMKYDLIGAFSLDSDEHESIQKLHGLAEIRKVMRDKNRRFSQDNGKDNRL